MGLDIVPAFSRDWPESIRVFALSRNLASSEDILAFCAANGFRYIENAEGFGETDCGIFWYQDLSLHSSYNDSGLNRVLDRKGLPNLYDIFSPETQPKDMGEGFVRTDLVRAAGIAREVADRFSGTSNETDMVRFCMKKIMRLRAIADVNGHEGFRLFWSA